MGLWSWVRTGLDLGQGRRSLHTPLLERLEPRILLSVDTGLSSLVDPCTHALDEQAIEVSLTPGSISFQQISQEAGLVLDAAVVPSMAAAVVPQSGVDRLWTQDRSPQLTGTVGDPEAAVEVTVDGHTYAAVNRQDGTWALAQGTIAPQLADGIYEVHVAATDQAGHRTSGTPAELIVAVTSRPWSFVEPFDQGPAAGWEYYSTNQGRIQVVDGRLILDDAVGDHVWSLNEAILHLDLSNVSNVILTFDHFSTGVEQWLPVAAVSGSHTLGDGVSLSLDGRLWFRISDLAEDFVARPFDLEPVLTQAVFQTGSADRSDVRIKFQQYNAYPVPTQGRQFDNIRLEGLAGPAVQVLGGGQSIVCGDTTPEAGDLTDFGQVAQDGPDPTQVFQIQNTGQGILVVEGVEVPAGFQWVDSTGTFALWPGESYGIAVAFDAEAGGVHTGDVQITTNDAAQPEFTFRIRGEVVTVPPAVTSLSVADPTETTAGYTNQREVLVTMTEGDPDGTVTGWMITESWDAPDPDSPTWLDARPSTYVIQDPGDGLKWLYAWVKDNRGNVSEGAFAAQAKITLDTTGPGVTVSAVLTSERSPALRVFTLEEVLSLVVTVDQEDYVPLGTGGQIWMIPAHTIDPPLADGTYDVRVTAVDLAGNTGTEETADELIVDTTPPTVTVLPCLSAQLRPGLSGTVDDPSAAVHVTLQDAQYDAVNNGDGTWTLQPGVLSPVVTEGVHDVVATARDGAGNAGTDATTDELVIDLTAPSLSHSLVADDTGTTDDKNTSDTTPVLTLAFSEPVFGQSGDVVVLDPEGARVWPGSITGWGTETLVLEFTTPLALDGSYQVVLSGTNTITDWVGLPLNHGHDQVCFFVVDTRSPEVTIDPKTTSDARPELTGTVDEPGASVEVRIAGVWYPAVNDGQGAWSLPAGSITAPLAGGTYDVSVRAVDPAGNVGQDSTTDGLTIVAWALTADAVTVAEDSGTTAVDVLVNDVYVPDPMLGLVITAKTDGVQGGRVEIVDDGKRLTYTPAPDFNGEDTFAYTATDAEGRTGTATVVVTVTPVQDAPVLTTMGLLTEATRDSPYTITYDRLAAAAGITDVDGDPVEFRIIAISGGTRGLTKGTLGVVPGTPQAVLGPGESWVWTPALGATGVLNALVVEAWDGTLASAKKMQVNVQVDPLPDLQPTAVDSSVWQSAEPGTAAEWTVTIRNNGPGPQWSDWVVEWYLSKDSRYQASDTLVGSVSFSEPIASGASVSKTLEAVVPAVQAPGQKVLIARVVSTGRESKTSNNTKAGPDRDWFGEVLPDTDEPNAAPDEATDLGTLSNTWSQGSKTLDAPGDVDWTTFTTSGTAGKAHKVRISFAHKEGDLALGVYDADGTPLGEADGTGNAEQVSLLGLAEGTYTVRVWSNHGDVSPNYKLTIAAPAGPDLQPTAADSSVWQSAEPGTQVEWTVTVRNNGPGYQRADWTVQWFLSADRKLRDSDPLIGSETYDDDLAPGTEVSKAYSAPVPDLQTAGQRYVIARVVDAGAESKTSNNTKVSSDRDWFGLVHADGDEDNDSLETALDLGAFKGTKTWPGRTIDSAGDVDWYRFTTQRTGTSGLKVQINFTHAEGDLALGLVQSDGTAAPIPVPEVDGTGNTELIKLTGLLPGTYFLKVLSNPLDVSRTYKLTIVA